MIVNNEISEKIKEIIETHEDWLMERVLMYAKKQGYTAYTSTLKEAWRLSISGLSESLLEGLCHYTTAPEMGPEEDFGADPIARFGVIEAQRHKERGISLNMFLGLMKYYRQAYIDLVGHCLTDQVARQSCDLVINRMFDRMEIGFCVEWAGESGNKSLEALQSNNRLMTNEKNKYLTIFESIPNPVILLDRANKIDNMNFAAVNLFRKNLAPGSQYYSASKDNLLDDPAGIQVFEILPWFREEIEAFIHKNLESLMFEKIVLSENDEFVFRIKFSKNLDVSGKFDGTVIILEDITSLKKALANVKQLSGLLPICSHCKKIRDDQGYWQQIEQYIHERSEAQFSHGICRECAKKHYPDFDIYDEDDVQ